MFSRALRIGADFAGGAIVFFLSLTFDWDACLSWASIEDGEDSSTPDTVPVPRAPVTATRSAVVFSGLSTLLLDSLDVDAYEPVPVP